MSVKLVLGDDFVNLAPLANKIYRGKRKEKFF